MNHVEKETAENFYGTGERDHQLMLRYDGVRGCGALAGGYRPPEQKRCGDGAYAGKTPEWRAVQAKKLFAFFGKELFCLAEQVGFEPTGLERLTDFESASL